LYFSDNSLFFLVDFSGRQQWYAACLLEDEMQDKEEKEDHKQHQDKQKKRLTNIQKSLIH